MKLLVQSYRLEKKFNATFKCTKFLPSIKTVKYYTTMDATFSIIYYLFKLEQDEFSIQLIKLQCKDWMSLHGMIFVMK
jgi:hypothetical protein